MSAPQCSTQPGCNPGERPAAAVGRSFGTERDLLRYAQSLYAAGLCPDMAVVDAEGRPAVVSLSGCSADHLVYGRPDDHAHPNAVDRDSVRWVPRFPVTALALAATVSTVCDLDALPELSIVGVWMPAGSVEQHLFAIQKDHGWWGVGSADEISVAELDAVLAQTAAVVLWSPRGGNV